MTQTIPPVYTQYRIISVSPDLPDGDGYKLFVNNEVHPMRRVNGHWLSAAPG
jgi:hypothetical protein